MKVLMTGATGFIGSKIAKELLNENCELVILTRSPKEHSKTYLKNYEVKLHTALVKFYNEHDLGRALEQGLILDGVIHLAGESVAQRWTKSAKEKIYNSRVINTEKILSLLIHQKLKFFISASAIGCYGHRGEEMLTEKSVLANSFLANVCNDWENSVFKAKAFTDRVVTFRLGMVLGKDGGALKKMLAPFRLGVGGTLGDGKQWVSWVHVEDVAKMFIWAIKNEKARGVYNAVSPSPVRNLEFSKILAKVLGQKLFLPLPAVGLKILYGEMSQIILDSQKVIPQKLINEEFSFKHTNLEAALSSLVKK